MQFPPQNEGVTRSQFVQRIAPVVVPRTLYPQTRIGRFIASRPTGPAGPIGLPGQDCTGACWHVCASFAFGPSGYFFNQCMAECLSKCSDSASAIGGVTTIA